MVPTFTFCSISIGVSLFSLIMGGIIKLYCEISNFSP